MLNFINLTNSIVLFFTCLSFPSMSQNWKLVWADEFNGTSLNMNNWSYETGNGQGGWGTGQLDYATDRKENVDVRDGKLVITLREEEYKGTDYTSGRILSRNKYAVKYGKIEARIKVAAGRGIGCAFWMLPQSEKYGWWPASGEIDIVETNGHEPYKNYGTLHYKQWEGHQYKGHEVISETNLATEMHVYTLVWDEHVMRWYLDNKLFNEFYIKEPIDDRKPFNEDFFFIISGGVGSEFSGKKIEDNLLPQTFEVDYVRVYKGVEAPTVASASIVSNDQQIELVFSEHLRDPNKFYKDFKVNANGKELTVVGAEMKFRDNRTLVLQLENAVSKNALLTLSYAGDSITSYNDLRLTKFNAMFIVNPSLGSSPVPVKAATTDNFNIDLNVNKNLNKVDLKKEDFNAKLNGKEIFIKAININGSKLSTLSIQTQGPMFKGDSILLSYKGNSLFSIDSGMLKPFTDFHVANLLSAKFSIPGKIEAEDYSVQSGMMSEACNDEGAGRNMGYIEDGDWLEFEVYIKKSGSYKVEYRIASASANAVCALYTEGNLLTKTPLKPTTSWQIWATEKSEVFNLEEGFQKIKMTASKGGFNLNWLNIVAEGL